MGARKRASYWFAVASTRGGLRPDLGAREVNTEVIHRGEERGSAARACGGKYVVRGNESGGGAVEAAGHDEVAGVVPDALE